MTKLKMWISAARLRTLPLSISGILVGTGLALREGFFDAPILVFALLTTLGLQVLSNFANDYGDGIKGTDNHERIGPMRALQSGVISHGEMKKGIILTALLTLGFAITLIYFAFEPHEMGYVILFLVLGLAAIAAAIKYTVGETAYGYRGLGDLFVFLFFGLLGVVGSYFLYSKQLIPIVWLPAVVIGLLSTTVLNLNNMRDIKSDKNSGKITLAVKLGEKRAKRYHLMLVLVAFLGVVIYAFLDWRPINAIFILPFIVLGKHLDNVFKVNHPKALDPEMKKVALSTVAFALLYLVAGLF